MLDTSFSKEEQLLLRSFECNIMIIVHMPEEKYYLILFLLLLKFRSKIVQLKDMA